MNVSRKSFFGAQSQQDPSRDLEGTSVGLMLHGWYCVMLHVTSANGWLQIH